MARLFWVAVFGFVLPAHASGADPVFDRAKARAGKAGGEIKKPSGSEFYEHLYLDNNTASDDDVVAIVEDLKKAKPESKVRITDVYLGSALGDRAFKKIAELGTIEVLDARNTKVTDKGLAAVKGLKKLALLRLNGTEITDAGLQHLAGLKDLNKLDLEDTKVTDAGLKHLVNLGILKINAKGTKVTDVGVKLFKAGVVER